MRFALPALVVSIALLAACGVETGPAAGELVGTVLDAMSGEPIRGATVRIEGEEGAASTDATGRFAIASPIGVRSVYVAAHGYFALVRADVAIDEGEPAETEIRLYAESPPDALVDAHMAVRGSAQALRDSADDPALRAEVRAFLRGELPESALLPAASGPRAAGDGVAGARAALGAPPATVRIWRRSIDGAAASCSGRIDVIPLEDYVKGVLPHEWIASWHDESLRAGSLAIRTYVWNWVLRGGKYDCADLDDTTRSQVYADDRLPRTNEAVDATRGQGITRSGSLVSGEYSAENSSPTADGIVDALCVGRALFGHGRGMCQWGSQRWALDGRNHVWIAAHYWPGATVEGGAPAVPELAAELVGTSHPAEMTSGDRVEVWIELRNTGTRTWSIDTTRIGTTRPNDHPSPFYDAETWLAPNRATGADASTYTTGTVGRFTFTITAPEVESETLVTDTFGLVEESVAWLGPDDIAFAITVRPRPAPPPDPPPDDPIPDPTADPTDPMGTTPAAVHSDATLHGSCAAVPGSRSAPSVIWLFAFAILARRRRVNFGDKCTSSPNPPHRRRGSVN